MQIEEAAAWWAANRASVPGAVREDLDSMFSLLMVQPGMGVRARRATLKSVRRIMLSRIRYYVYYREYNDAIEVLAFWHTSRGDEPSL